jgi:Flp pilus assembly pilin Flp
VASGRKVTIEFIGKDTSAGRTASDLERQFGTLGRRMDKVGRVSGRLLAGGLILAAGAAVQAGQAAADDEAAQEQLAQQLRKAAGATDQQIASTEDWITAQGVATGMADDELRPALAKLATATGDVEEAQKLAALAMDVAAGSGKSYEQVTEAMVKAQNGNVGSLGRLGIATKDADGKTKSFAQIQQDLAGKYLGAAADAAETTAGKQKILSTQFGELQEQIGAKLLPVMVQLSEVGLKVVSWISDNTRVVGIFVASIAGLLAIATAVSGVMRIWTAVTTVWSAVTQIATGVQWLLNAAMAANPIGLVVIAIAALIAIVIIAYKNSETFREIVQAAFGAVAAAGEALWGWIKSAFNSIVEKWNEAKTVATAMAVAVVGKFQDVVDWVKGLPNKIKSALSDLTSTVRGLFDEAMAAGLEKVKNIGGDIKDWIDGIPAKLKEKVGDFKQAGKDLIGAVVDGMKNAAGVVSGIAGNVWDAVKGMLNGAIDKINAALEFTISLPGPDITVNPPNIPHLAKGGIVHKPTLALIGEDGPEAVVPLGKKNAPRGGIGIGGGGDTYIFHIQSLDPAAAGAAVEKALIRLTRERGRPLQVSTI